jgi:hypothetical protein
MSTHERLAALGARIAAHRLRGETPAIGHDEWITIVAALQGQARLEQAFVAAADLWLDEMGKPGSTDGAAPRSLS